jgi:ribosome modulation factor
MAQSCPARSLYEEGFIKECNRGCRGFECKIREECRIRREERRKEKQIMDDRKPPASAALDTANHDGYQAGIRGYQVWMYPYVDDNPLVVARWFVGWCHGRQERARKLGQKPTGETESRLWHEVTETKRPSGEEM